MASYNSNRKQNHYHNNNNHNRRRQEYPPRHQTVVHRESRPYQTELLQSALNGNRIIALGTGAGKTHIACMLINEMVSTGSFLPGQRTMFLAPTDALVRQQAHVIYESTGLVVRDYMGGTGISEWAFEKWELELDNVDVLVMIAQSALNALNNGVLLVSRIGLLIFDECHHARRNHPYREIMRTLEVNVKRLQCEAPKILGLSASIVTRNIKDFDQVEKEISELEEILHCKAVTTTDSQSMSIHATNPIEIFECYDICPIRRLEYVGELKLFLNFFLQKDNVKFAGWEFPVRNTVDVCKIAVGDCIYALNELGTKSCLKCIELYKSGLYDYLDNSYNRILTDLDVSFISNTQSVLRKLKADIMAFYKEDSSLSPKVLKLCEVLKSYHLTKISKKEDEPQTPTLPLSGIVFLNRRICAVLLRDIFFDLRRRGYSFLKCGSVVGHGCTSLIKGAEMSIYEQEHALRSFRSGETNLLFATNVLEEGLDVPQCNLIVRFDPPLTPRSYIQSKGRARNKEAILYHMIPKDGLPEQMKSLDTFKRIEDTLTKKCQTRDDTITATPADIIDIPPYIINSTGAKITGASAIQLINSYCQRLCRDPFYIPKPCCVTRKVEQPLNSGFVCNLILPEKAPIRDIMKSQVWKTSESAKREAHMNTCMKLHELGEFNDYLQFKPKKGNNEEGEKDELLEKLSRITLSDSNNSYYEKKIPSALSKPINLSDANENKFIYKFTIVLKESGMPYWGQENNEQFKINPNNYVGIVTAESIPIKEFPTFEVYYHDLNLKVTIELVRTKTPLEKVYTEILKFQQSVFCEVLKYNEADNFAFFPGQPNNRSFLICPLIQLEAQQWDFDLDCLKNFNSREELTSNKEEFYLKRVVSTKHKPASRLFHIITMDPKTTLASPFPEKNFASFAEYFTKNYNYVFKEEDYTAHALEAINVSGHINLITSRHKTPKGKELPKTDYSKRQKILLFSPQLIAHPIPSTLWRLCVILPSILWRVESFLLVLEFSASVERYLGPNRTCDPAETAEDLNDTPAHLNYETVPELCVNDCGEKPDLISLLSAFTAPSAGDLINYERQEFIGDGLLKLIVTLHVFTQSSLRSEGDLSSLRSKFVSNDTLHWLAVKKAMVHIMRVEKFQVRRTYSPPGFDFSTNALLDSIGDISSGKDKLTTSDDLLILSESACSAFKPGTPARQHLPFRFQQFSDKTSADCIEAVLSSYVCSGGIQQGLRFVSFLDMGINYNQQTIDSNRSKHDKEMGHFFNPPNAFASYAADYKYAEFHLEFSEEDVSDLPPYFFKNILEFQKIILNYNFRNISLLIEAFTHPSFLLKITPTDKPRPSYQRLEFLGDALLDYFITVYTYQKYKNLLPEQLSRLRVSIVNNSRLSTISLDKLWYICILCNDKLQTCIKKSETEYKHELQYNKNFHISDYLRVNYPKPLGDIVESVIAAVFIDSGFSLDATWDVFRPIFKPIVDGLALNIPKNPINHLYELKPRSTINITKVKQIESGRFECKIQVDGKSYIDQGTSGETAKFKCAQKAVEDIQKKS